MLSEFIRLITQHIDRAIYVWGGQGQIVTSETQIRRMEQTVGDADRAIALWNKRKAAGIDPVYMFDCSGLIIWALQKLALIDYDTTAHGLYIKSKPINAGSVRVGDFVFKVKEGRAVHIGIVTRQGYVTEAYGRDRGVIERAMTVGGWNAYGSNPFIDTSAEVSEMKKGDTGEAVRLWQTDLLAAGYKMIGTDGTEYGADGDFGGATERATVAFQLASGLPGSGVVGDLTWAAMVKAISTKLATALQEEAARAAYLVKQVKEQTGIIDKLKAENSTMKTDLVNADLRNQALTADNNAMRDDLRGTAKAFDLMQRIKDKYIFG